MKRTLLAAAIALSIGVQIPAWISMLPDALAGTSDFRALYAAGYMVRSGHASQIYDYDTTMRFQNQVVSPEPSAFPFIHLAYETLPLAALSFLPYRAAYLAFLLFNLFLLFCITRLLSLGWKLSLALSAFLPVGVAVLQGQPSIITLAFFLLAAMLLRDGSDFLAGVLVGLTVYKFQVAVPVVLLFLLWRHWRFVAGAITSSLGCLAVSWAIIGTRGVESYLLAMRMMSSAGSATDHAKFAYLPISMPNLRGLFSMMGAGNAVVVAVSLAVVAYAALMLRESGDNVLKTVVAVLAAVLVTYHMQTHELAVLLLPLLRAVEESQWAGLAIYAALPLLILVHAPFCISVVPMLALFFLFCVRGSESTKELDLKVSWNWSR
jgi:glycosyl transferase family 87